MARKKIAKICKLQFPAGGAKPGPALASAGINMPQFCTDFNAKTQDRKGDIVPVIITDNAYEAKVAEVAGVVNGIVGPCDNIIVNGTGKYVCHSSQGDAGTTGRKLAVDFYGGNCRVGGGSPWTKDPTKADLTLNLYARKRALDYLKAHGLPECHVQIGCCIGRRDIIIQYFDRGMNLLDTQYESKGTSDVIAELDLDRPIYTKLVRMGLPNYIGGSI